MSPAAGEAAVVVVGVAGAVGGGSDTAFSLSGDPACLLSFSRSFSETPLSMSVDGRGDPKLPRMLVRLLVRSPGARTLPPPPISKLPNLRTSVAPGDPVGVAGDSTTSGVGLGSGAACSVDSSSIRSANDVSSGPAVRGASCPLTLTLSCPCSPTPLFPPPPPAPNMLAQPRGTPWRWLTLCERRWVDAGGARGIVALAGLGGTEVPAVASKPLETMTGEG